MFGDFGELGAPRRPRRRRRRRRRAGAGARCKRVTYKRRTKGGRVLPRSQWVTVTRCKGRRLRAHNRRQCRRGKGKTFRARQFVEC